MWKEEEPSSLRPAIDALERTGFVNVHRGIAMGDSKVPAEFRIKDIAGIAVKERLHEYFDELER